MGILLSVPIRKIREIREVYRAIRGLTRGLTESLITGELSTEDSKMLDTTLISNKISRTDTRQGTSMIPPLITEKYLIAIREMMITPGSQLRQGKKATKERQVEVQTDMKNQVDLKLCP